MSGFLHSSEVERCLNPRYELRQHLSKSIPKKMPVANEFTFHMISKNYRVWLRPVHKDMVVNVLQNIQVFILMLAEELLDTLGRLRKEPD